MASVDKMRLMLMFGLLFHGIVLSWVLKIERRCDCSDDWRRDFIKYFTIAMIAYNLYIQATGRLVSSPLITGPILIGGFVQLYSVLSYIPSLHKKDCSCATQGDWRDNFIFWWTSIGLVLSVLGASAVLMKR